MLCREGEKGDDNATRSVIIHRDFPGIYATKITEKLGWRCSDTATISFEDVIVPKENIVLGREGMSPMEVNEGLLNHLVKERQGANYMAIGIARGVFRRLWEYLSTRELERKDGKISPLTTPEVHERLRPMRGRILEKQRLILSIAQDIDQGFGLLCIEDIFREKMDTVEMAIDTAKNAIQLAGGHGYLGDSHFPRYFTTAMVLSIGGGTMEIQKKILNKMCGFPR